MKTKVSKFGIFSYLFLTLILILINPHKTYATSSLNEQKTAGISASVLVKEGIKKDDYRVKVIKKFLEQHDSPLSPSAENFVTEADKYKLDWKLLVAISGVESTFGKELPYNSYNAWGWGIYGDNMYYFKSYKEGIETISQSIREDYINKWGSKDIYEIGKFYAASPTWAQRVVYFMDKIENFKSNDPANILSLSL